MKMAGLIIMGIGLLMTLYTGYYYVTKETVVDFGPVEVTKDKEHGAHWSPAVGVAVMVIGGVVLAVGSKKS